MTLPTTDNTTNPLQWGFDVLLNSTYYRLATGPQRELVIESAPLQAQRVDTTSSAEEISNEFGTRFARADFSGGEGLAYAHRTTPTSLDPTRYFDSKNINVDDEGRLTLLEAGEVLDSNASATQRGVYADGNVWFTAGTTLRKTSDPEAASPVWANDDPHAGEGATTATAIVALGTDVYVALGANGVHKLTSGGAWTHWSDFAATNIWAVKGRIMGTDAGGDLYEVKSGATTGGALISLPSDQTWNAVVDGGAFILAAASDGHVYSLTFDGTDIAFSGAQSDMEGQEPTALAEFFGVVLLATRESITATDFRVRFFTGVLEADGILSGLTVVQEWDGTDLCIGKISVSTRSSAWFALEQGSDTHMWRYDLENGGLHRSHVISGAGVSRSLFSVNSQMWAIIDGIGASRASSSYATSGYLISPLADFFTADDKAWASVRGFLSSVPAGTKVTVSYATSREALDDPTGTAWRTATTLNSLNSPEATLEGVESRSLAIKLTFTGTASTTPVLDSFTVRAYPGPGDKRVSLPINVSDQTERWGRRNIRVPGRGNEVFNSLRSLEGTAVELTLLREGLQLDGTIERVTQPSPMNAPRGSSWMVSTVVFRGRLAQTGQTTNNIMGLNLLGEGLLGLPEGEAA